MTKQIQSAIIRLIVLVIFSFVQILFGGGVMFYQFHKIMNKDIQYRNGIEKKFEGSIFYPAKLIEWYQRSLLYRECAYARIVEAERIDDADNQYRIRIIAAAIYEPYHVRLIQVVDGTQYPLPMDIEPSDNRVCYRKTRIHSLSKWDFVDVYLVLVPEGLSAEIDKYLERGLFEGMPVIGNDEVEILHYLKIWKVE